MKVYVIAIFLDYEGYSEPERIGFYSKSEAQAFADKMDSYGRTDVFEIDIK